MKVKGEEVKKVKVLKLKNGEKELILAQSLVDLREALDDPLMFEKERDQEKEA